MSLFVCIFIEEHLFICCVALLFTIQSYALEGYKAMLWNLKSNEFDATKLCFVSAEAMLYKPQSNAL